MLTDIEGKVSPRSNICIEVVQNSCFFTFSTGKVSFECFLIF